MPGATGECEWQGIHKFEELVQVANPPQGYMQNCNVSPFAMMKDSPLVPEKYADHPYLYNDGRKPPHQRAAMMVDLLDAAHDVTAEQMIGIAFNPQVWHADLWQERIRKAAPQSEFAKLLTGWNRRSDSDSRAALAFYFFKTALGPLAAAFHRARRIPHRRRRSAPPSTKPTSASAAISAPTPSSARSSVSAAKARNRTWPVSGGTLTEAGMATPRAISFDPVGKELVGRTGQTSTQIVILTKPPQSYMVIPLGESDHPNSAHYDDQAEKLFSKARAKPTYFANRKELEKHVTAKKELSY